MYFSADHESSTGRTILEQRFEHIFYASKDRLYYYVKKYIRGHDAIQEIVQQCYIRLWEQLPSVDRDEKVFALLSTIAYHLVIDMVRKEARTSLKEQLFTAGRSEAIVPEDRLRQKEVLEAYSQAVEALPPRRQLIYRLVRENGLSHQEIAERLKISKNTIERHVNEAMRTLRQQLSQDELIVIFVLLQFGYLISTINAA